MDVITATWVNGGMDVSAIIWIISARDMSVIAGIWVIMAWTS